MPTVRPHHIISVLAFGGIVLAAVNFNSQPLFQNTDNFVLFAQEEIKLEQGVQISSGDLGSNKKIDIEKDAIINGNLFADRISIDKNTTINGNASFNKLQIKKESEILGTQTKPIQLPIVNLPEIPEFTIGTQDFKFEGENNTLPSGNYRNITIEKNSKLILTGGTYNLNKLELKENSTLIFQAPITLNIQFKLKGQQRVSILPGQNLNPTDLAVNYIGIKSKKEKQQKEDDDEIESEMDEKERKDLKDGKIGRPVVFGKDNFLNFKLVAPKAKVNLGDETTFRGQILAKEIKIGKGSVLSRAELFVKESDPKKVIIDQDNSRFLVNEIMVNFTDVATLLDAQNIANLVDGRIIGFIKSVNAYQIEVITDTPEELETKIQLVRQLSHPLVEGVFRNYLLNLAK